MTSPPLSSMRERFTLLGASGLRACVCAWGSDNGRPILILHGFLEQGAAWDAVACRLSGRIVAPDHRGHGRSDHVGRGGFYHFWDYVSDVDALVETLGGPVDLVGHSMGGTIAVLFAATRPDKVRRLVLVEGMGPPDRSTHRLSQARTYLEHRRRAATHAGLASIDDAALRMKKVNPALDPMMARALATRITRPTTADDPHLDPQRPGPLVWRWDPLHRCRSPRAFEAHSFTTFLRAIEAPTLSVIGADSMFATSDRSDRAASIPVLAQVVIPGSGHLVHHDQPAALAQHISEHLA